MSKPRAKKLNAKEERACLLFVKYGNQLKAYREAGYAVNAKDSTARSNASRFFLREQVSARVAELKAESLQGVGVTREWLLDRMQIEATREDSTASHSARVKALAHLAVWAGFFGEGDDDAREWIIEIRRRGSVRSDEDDV
mgnify:CR=1 FL=1